MKAGAFGRTPTRRDVQPGGLALPGMFTSPSSSPGPSSSSSSSSAKPASSDSSSPLISSWGTTKGRPARAVSTAEPSRLERLQEERRRSEAAGLSARRRVASMSAGTTEENDSISRARRLGLNRASRKEPTPPSSEGEEEEKEDKGWFSSAPKPIAMLPGMSSFKRTFTPPPASPPSHQRAASIDAPIPRSEAGTEQPQTLLGSLWGRAAQLVGAGGATGEHVVKEVPLKKRDESAVSELPAPESKVTPFKLHEGEEGEEEDQKSKKEQSNLTNTRAVALPPLVARALSDPTNATSNKSRRPAVPTLPYMEPITYRRPPPLYPRDTILAAGTASLGAQRFVHRDPYDWLETKDESPLDPYLFHRAVGRAATRKGKSRAARNAARPGMPVGMRTDSGPGVVGVAAGGIGAGMGMRLGMAAAGGGAGPPPGMEGLFRTLTTHPSLPLSAPIPNPAHNAVTGFVPQLPQHGYDQPPAVPHPLTPAPVPGAVAPHPAYPAGQPGTAPVALAGAGGLVGGYAAAQLGHPSTMYPEGSVPGTLPVSSAPLGVAGYEHAVEAEHPGVAATGEGISTAAPLASTAIAGAHAAATTAEEAFPRSAAGPNGLPVFPAPAPPTPAPQVSAPPPPQYSAPPAPATVPASAPAAPASAPVAGPSQPPPPPAPHPVPAAVPPPALAPALPAVAVAAAPVPAPAPAAPGLIRAALGAQLSASRPPAQPQALPAAYPPGTTYHPQYGFLPPGSCPPPAGHIPAPLPTPHPDTATGTSAAGGLPAMPIPRPILATPTPPPPGTTATSSAASLYPPHLVPAMQGQQQTTFPPPVGWPGVPAAVPYGGVWPPQPIPGGGGWPVVPAGMAGMAVVGGSSTGIQGQQQGVASPNGAERPEGGEGRVEGEEDKDDEEGKEENDPDLPTYASTTAPSAAPTLAVPALTALNTPLPPSPAPTFLPSPSSTSPAPSDASAPAPVLARPSLDLGAEATEESLLPAYETAPTASTSSPSPADVPSSISSPLWPPPIIIPSNTSADSLVPSSAAQFVFTPPTPVAPQATPLAQVGDASTTAAYPPRPALSTKEADEEEQEAECAPSPAPAPLPALEPLSLSFSLGDFGSGLGEFAFDATSPTGAVPPAEGEGFLSLASFGLNKVGEEVEVEKGRELPYPVRASSPAVEFGTEVDEELEEEEEDPLSDAFEAATHFATSFAEADLARAAADPNHTERTERWLAQMGVERRSVGDLAVANPAQAVPTQVRREPPFGHSIYRPPTAPPASLPPDLVRRASSTSFIPPVPPLPPSPRPPTSSSLSLPSSSHIRSRSLTTLNPAFALNLRTNAEEAEDDAAHGPPSPLETSIHVNDVLNRGRAVPSAAGGGADGGMEGSQFSAARGRGEVVEAVQAKLSNAAFASSSATPGSSRAASAAPAPSMSLNGGEGKKDGKKEGEGEKEEPLTGDKGETASEVAAMFAGW